jgi:hypothetical protein
VSSATSDIILQGINSLIILGAWTVWTHRNRCVFDGATLNIARALIIAGEERKLWLMAGARGISLLTAPVQKVRFLVLVLVALLFDGATSNIARALIIAGEERKL